MDDLIAITSVDGINWASCGLNWAHAAGTVGVVSIAVAGTIVAILGSFSDGNSGVWLKNIDGSGTSSSSSWGAHATTWWRVYFTKWISNSTVLLSIDAPKTLQFSAQNPRTMSGEFFLRETEPRSICTHSIDHELDMFLNRDTQLLSSLLNIFPADIPGERFVFELLLHR